jgi:hypothetical protein
MLQGMINQQVISPLSAFKTDELTDFIRHSYATFDFKAMYAPNDLNRRGFPVNQLDQQKFRNYGYGRDMLVSSLTRGCAEHGAAALPSGQCCADLSKRPFVASTRMMKRFEQTRL